MKDVGYGRDYQYAHNYEEVTTDMETLPKKFKGRKYYDPGHLGLEKEIKKRIDWWNDLKKKVKSKT